MAGQVLPRAFDVIGRAEQVRVEIDRLPLEQGFKIPEDAFHGPGDAQGIGAILSDDHEHNRGLPPDLGGPDARAGANGGVSLGKGLSIIV